MSPALEVAAFREAVAEWHDRLAEAYAEDYKCLVADDDPDLVRVEKYAALRQEHRVAAEHHRSMSLPTGSFNYSVALEHAAVALGKEAFGPNSGAITDHERALTRVAVSAFVAELLA